MRQTKNKLSGQFAMAISVILFFILFLPYLASVGVLEVRADTTPEYTEVLEDLQKDPAFRAEDYPVLYGDHSVQVIAIAESENGELFIYGYHPGGAVLRPATSINISTALNDSLFYENYKLKQLSASGTLAKYIVVGVTVKSDVMRYYSISSIFRAWDKAIDSKPGGDNTVQEVSYAVGKLFTAITLDGEVSYTCTEEEVINITDKFVGFVRYSDGFKFFSSGACDSYFVAFNTDKPIDKLLEADVYYTSQSFHHPSAGRDEFGAKQDFCAHLKYTDRVEHTGGGWFAGTYKWDRIETVEQFIAENDLTQNVYSDARLDVNTANIITAEATAALESKKWLLRFAEFSYSKSVLGGTYGTVYTEDLTLVGEVTILRLKFETSGKVYNLGVVDNKQTGSRLPVNTNKTEDGGDWLAAVILIGSVLITIALIIWLFYKVFCKDEQGG